MKNADDPAFEELLSQADLPVEVAWPDRLVATINAVPWIGGVIAAWFSQDRQQVVLGRIRSCLLAVVAKLDRIEHDLEKLRNDDELAEISVAILEIVARTQNESKRECFANMLANAAISDNSAEREKVYSMAALLDQLDYIHVSTLDHLMNMPCSQNLHFFGAVRKISKVDVTDFSKDEHYALGVLEEMGIIDMSELRKNLERPGAIEVRSRGIRLYSWISQPSLY